MASAPIDTVDTGGDQDNAPVDYESAARKMGWSPAEDFKGDPAKHIDAETFVKRGEELMPILKAQNKTLLKRLDQAERTAKQAAEFFSKAEQRAYERAVADIRAEQEAAVESGDLTAHRAAADKLDKLEKPTAAASETPAHDPAQAAEEFADWSKVNNWYAQPDKAPLRIYADAQAELIAKPGQYLTPADLEEIARRVKAKFPEEFTTKDDGDPEPRRRSAVDGGNAIPPRRGGKSYNDLPSEAKQACDKFVRLGYVKTREDYVKNYQW